jgi:hypothetical protein
MEDTDSSNVWVVQDVDHIMRAVHDVEHTSEQQKRNNAA